MALIANIDCKYFFTVLITNICVKPKVNLQRYFVEHVCTILNIFSAKFCISAANISSQVLCICRSLLQSSVVPSSLVYYKAPYLVSPLQHAGYCNPAILQYCNTAVLWVNRKLLLIHNVVFSYRSFLYVCKLRFPPPLCIIKLLT